MNRLQFDISKRLMALLLVIGVFILAAACSGPVTPNAVDTSTPTPTATSTTVPSEPTASMSLPQLEIREVSTVTPEYDRKLYKHWVDADGDCQNAREEALVAESLIEVSFDDDRECKVDKGQWLASYTGTTVQDSGALDMDHMVPLKNAHLSGGWAWDAQRREDYANNLTYENHLIGVTASANRSKGAKGPEDWTPTAVDYRCQYAVDWVTIKAEWGLSANAAEWDALQVLLDTCDLDVVIVGDAPVPTQQTPTPTPIATAPVAPGDVIITEIMPNPSAVRDSDGEWFEIHNTTSDTEIDINGWTIRDDGSNSHVINNGGPLLVPPGGFLVLGRSSDFSINGGVPVDYQILSSFSLTNTQDAIVLVDETGAEIDRLEYDADLVFIGRSASLNPDAFDAVSNDDADNWCSSETAMVSGDKGTPGAENDACL